jgi:hypothetical protein
LEGPGVAVELVMFQARHLISIRSRLPAQRALECIGDPTVEEPEGIDSRL